MRSLLLLLALALSSPASVVWVESGLVATESAAFQILPLEITGETQADFRFESAGGFWTLSSLPAAGHGSVLAYAGMLAILLPGYSTLPGSNWAHAATLTGWWRPDGVPQWIGLLPNPADDDREASRYHALMAVSWNTDQSLTIHRWGYETVPGVPLAVPVPELRASRFLLFPLISICCLRRQRGS